MPETPPQPGTWIRLAGAVAAALAVCWPAGMAVRLTVRDAFVPAPTLYHATPVVVLAAVARLAGLLWRLSGPALDSAFETAGRGHHASWPVPCPVLAIDHAWGSRRLRVVSWLGRTWRSDHLPVIVEVVPAGCASSASAPGPRGRLVVTGPGPYDPREIRNEVGLRAPDITPDVPGRHQTGGSAGSAFEGAGDHREPDGL